MTEAVTEAVAEAAPYLSDIADGRVPGAAHWLATSDGVRIRAGHWRPDGAAGTILMFPGRTEYVEKYSHFAAEMAARGYATLAVDWRGQGIADRLLPNRAVGHVGAFSDYQRDVAAVLGHARTLDLPEPFHLIGHSMGGAIGLRALHDGLPVRSAAFTGPMWGIGMSVGLRPVAWSLSALSKPLGFSHVFAPGQVPDPYVLREDFEGNTLTSDRDMWDWMRGHLQAHPELALGGPSLHWLHEALREIRHLTRRPAPPMGCLAFVGAEEAIADPARIKARVDSWPGGTLVVVPGARHEVLLERPEIRARVHDRLIAQFEGAAPRAA